MSQGSIQGRGRAGRLKAQAQYMKAALTVSTMLLVSTKLDLTGFDSATHNIDTLGRWPPILRDRSL